MTSAMRYDHGMIGDHVGAQSAVVARIEDKRQQAKAVLADMAGFWTANGSNAYQQCHQQIDMIINGLEEFITSHGTAQTAASTTSAAADAAAAAGFSRLM